MDIGDSFQNATDAFFDFLPNLLGFLVILLVGYIVAKVVAGVVGKLLDKLHIDRKLQESSARRYVDAALPGASPANGIARVVFWLIFIFFIVTAVGALGHPGGHGLHEPGAGLPAQHHRGHPDLRRRRAALRCRRGRGREVHGRHPHRQGRRRRWSPRS